MAAKVREYHTERSVHFVVRMDGKVLKAAEEKEGIEAAMRLKSSINETNMVLFDHEGRIMKYKSVKDIMQEFAKVRMKMSLGVVACMSSLSMVPLCISAYAQTC